jgi:hypothetical protein
MEVPSNGEGGRRKGGTPERIARPGLRSWRIGRAGDMPSRHRLDALENETIRWMLDQPDRFRDKVADLGERFHVRSPPQVRDIVDSPEAVEHAD